jgi:uncharacterized protein (UPF0332 family)
VSPTLGRLLGKRRLVKSRLGEEAIKKELNGARYDLKRAKVSLDESDYKWATIEAYYSMFHAARALLYVAGYRERSHSALLVALRELYVKAGKLAQSELDNFENAMNLRQEADYSLSFYEESARRVADDAGAFIEATTALTRIEQKQRAEGETRDGVA